MGFLELTGTLLVSNGSRTSLSLRDIDAFNKGGRIPRWETAEFQNIELIGPFDSMNTLHISIVTNV